ncbi:MAG TPA: diacylglycerol kinase family protein [Candidatus Angelobacter sp.]|nr:diacylglycerol kinase family protein [Candidatus Angelobacter sp.]
MTAAALLHPDVPPEAVASFRAIYPELSVVPDLKGIQGTHAALIFGGDGTVHRYLGELYKHQIPALVVPKGSGNDFAKALGIADEQAALGAWNDFCVSGGKNVKEIDLGIIKTGDLEALFCCVAGTGLDAAANARANRMPAWLRGTGGYLLAALHSLVSFAPAEFSVDTDGRQIRRVGFFVAVGNAHRYGSGMKVAPRATLDDGLFDICFIGAMNKLKLLFAVPTIFFGAHLHIRQVEYFQAQSVSIAAERPLDVYADGEYICQTPAKLSLIPRALKVIVPS